MKLDILAFGAHPDDVELGCGATIAKEVSLGKKVGIVDLTRGELGSRGSADLRDEEAAIAAKILGISVRENLRFADGFFANDKTHQLQIIKMIRKYQPEIVLCNAVDDRHIDHPKASNLVSDACFLSGLIKIETELEGQQQEKWRPQFYNPRSKEPETPISSENFTDSVQYRAKDLGRLIGVEFAEGFTAERYVAVENLDKLI
jgi:bacillithiol biosynthesis deacetylase BshB1